MLIQQCHELGSLQPLFLGIDEPGRCDAVAVGVLFYSLPFAKARQLVSQGASSCTVNDEDAGCGQADMPGLRLPDGRQAVI